MSLFSYHTEKAKASRIKLDLSAEAPEIEADTETTEDQSNDPLDAVVEVGNGEADVGETADEAAEPTQVDAFAEQRERLNNNTHGMIRSRMTAEAAEPEVEADAETGEEAPVEEPGESEAEVTSEETEGNTNIGEDVVIADTNSLPEVDGEQVTDVKDSGDVDVPTAEEEVAEPAETEEAAAADEGDKEEEDEDGDEDGDEDAADALSDEVESELMALEALGNEVSMIDDSIIAIENFGVNPTAIAIMQTTGLLDGTALSSIGLEAFGFHAAKDAESLMALEALNDKAEEKSASWAAKIVGFAKGIGSKIMGVLSPIWNKVSEATKSLASGAWEKAKDAGAVIKAHPYATVITLVVAVAAVAGVATFAAGGLPALTAKGTQVVTFAKSLGEKISSINLPFGSIKTTVSETTGKIGVKIVKAAGSAKSGAMSALGWTKNSFSALSGKLSTAWTSVSTGVKSLGARALKTFDAASLKALPSKVAGSVKNFTTAAKSTGGKVGRQAVGLGVWFAQGLLISNLIGAVIKTVVQIVSFALRIVIGTLKAIGRVVGIGKKD